MSAVLDVQTSTDDDDDDIPPRDETDTASTRKAPWWTVWKTLDNLQAQLDTDQAGKTSAVSSNHGGDSDRRHPPSDQRFVLRRRVLEILQLWGSQHAGDNQWQSLLNKKSLQHEIEEATEAVWYLQEWRRTVAESSSSQTTDNDANNSPLRFTCLDVCGGKGIFSMLLQYIASRYWTQHDGPILERILLIEKATHQQINWDHLKAPPSDNTNDKNRNQEATSNSRQLVPVLVWENTDILDHDSLLKRLQQEAILSNPLALVGIHLCKFLSPALIGLFNMLGTVQCPFLLVAPCCMPRIVRSKRHMKNESRVIKIWQYESPDERKERWDRFQQRQVVKRKVRPSGNCFLCQSPDHWLRKCPDFLGLDQTEQKRLLRQAVQVSPCWQCGIPGHMRSECPNHNDSLSFLALEPPSVEINVAHVLKEPDPVWTYCQLLARTVAPSTSTKDNAIATVYDTGLTNQHVIKPQSKDSGNKPKTSWNQSRKSFYIVFPSVEVTHHCVECGTKGGHSELPLS